VGLAAGDERVALGRGGVGLREPEQHVRLWRDQDPEMAISQRLGAGESTLGASGQR
jgi:hypothetical protein